MRTFYYLLALTLAALNLRPAITSISPLLESIQASLGMSGATASLLTTLPVLCMGIFSPFAAVISKKIGLERAIFVSLIFITVATLMRGVVGSVVLLVVTAFLAGIGIGLAGPLLSGFIKQHFPTKPGFVSVYSVSLVIGAGIATGFAVPVYDGFSGNWQLALAVWGTLGVIALLAWIGLIQKRPTALKTTNAALPFRDKRALLITLFFGFMATVFYTVTAWAAPIVISFGYSTAMAAAGVTVFQFIQIPVSLVLPSIVSKYGYITPALIGCSAIELVGVICLLVGVHPLLALGLIGFGAGGLFPLALMIPIIETDTADKASALSALNQGGGYIFAALGPLAVGTLFDVFGTFKPALYVLLVVIMSMGVVQYLLGRPAKVEGVKNKLG
ncbi:MFS transporter [Shouchella lehensis]|uniref:Major facilitator superfamily (MFS) transporter n=1 Tax=Shouchella lehensis G1 TaxID=1246626 RepID=A0A060M1V1_9BACI|nr:MFS transporter [Shouchella lehensis]AIC96427.1 major facilitator superfamily (MFS) transporter [Shouchella lehensis G1]RQW19019.1 MFS transporter [Bacillus sp. C1-1]